MCNTNNNQPLQPLFGCAHHIAKWMHPIYNEPAAPGKSSDGNLSLIDNSSHHNYCRSYRIQRPQHKPNSHGMVPPSSAGRLHQHLVRQLPVDGIGGSINMQNESRLHHPLWNAPMAHQQDSPPSDLSISPKLTALHPSSPLHQKNKHHYNNNTTTTQQSTTVLDSQVFPFLPSDSHHHNRFNSFNSTAGVMLPNTHHYLFGLFSNREGWICHDRESYCKVPLTGTLSGNK